MRHGTDCGRISMGFIPDAEVGTFWETFVKMGKSFGKGTAKVGKWAGKGIGTGVSKSAQAIAKAAKGPPRIRTVQKTAYRGGYLDQAPAQATVQPSAQPPAMISGFGKRRPNPFWTLSPSQEARKPFPTYDERPYMRGGTGIYQPYGRFGAQRRGPFYPADLFGGEPAYPTSLEASMFGIGTARGAHADGCRVAPGFAGAHADNGGAP